MTNKIELLTNSLSDPEIIDSSVGKLVILIVIWYISYVFYLFVLLGNDSFQQEEDMSENTKHFSLSINDNSNSENSTTYNNLSYM